MLALALRLGKTLRELREQLSAEELLLWMAYDRESPISDMRGDVQAAIIAAAPFQAQGGKVSASDMLPTWKAAPVIEAEEDAEDDFKAFLKGRVCMDE